MGKFGNKPVIGILGAIASGKSVVAAEFAKMGCAVINADEMAKSMLDRGEIKLRIVEYFGTIILDNSGNIDKKKLAAVVFEDAAKLNELTKILHPPVLEQTEALISAYQKQCPVKAIILDVPLLAEVGWDKKCDYLVFVRTDEATRYARAAKRGLGVKQLKARENFQISLDKKASMADYIVDNNSDLSELNKQVSRIFSSILNA